MKKLTDVFRSPSLEKTHQLGTSREQLDSLKHSGRFLGVKIDRCDCSASSKLAGKVFTFDNAPPLPVTGCDTPSCKCQYLGVANRRQEPNRRSNRERRKSIRMEEDRRSGNERRKNINNWKGYDK